MSRDGHCDCLSTYPADTFVPVQPAYFPRGNKTIFPAGRVHLPSGLRDGKFRKHAKPLIEEMKRTAPAMFSISNVQSFFASDGPEMLDHVTWQQEVESETSQDWGVVNGNILECTAPISFILSSDESDMTIMRMCRETSKLSETNIVMACDSDFNFVPPAHEIPWTLHYKRFASRRLAVANDKPHVLTSNTSLHDHPRWIWKEDITRHLVTLAAGHDYLPRGMKGAGLFSLSRLASLEKVG